MEVRRASPEQFYFAEKIINQELKPTPNPKADDMRKSIFKSLFILVLLLKYQKSLTLFGISFFKLNLKLKAITLLMS